MGVSHLTNTLIWQERYPFELRIWVCVVRNMIHPIADWLSVVQKLDYQETEVSRIDETSLNLCLLRSSIPFIVRRISLIKRFELKLMASDQHLDCVLVLGGKSNCLSNLTNDSILFIFRSFHKFGIFHNLLLNLHLLG